MKYYYFSYMTGDSNHVGNSIWKGKGEFSLSEVHSYLARMEKTTAIILSFQEVSETQYIEFEKYCKSVAHGANIPVLKPVIKLIKSTDGTASDYSSAGDLTNGGTDGQTN